MKLKKYLVVGALMGGLVLADLSSAENAPKAGKLSNVTYFDSATLAPNTKPDGAVYTFIDSNDPAVATIMQFGFKTIDRVGGMLITEVNRELATKETSDAVMAMHLKGLELPKPMAGQPTVTAIKRTSLMLRDPLNTPDGADMAALDKIHKQLMADQSPDKVIVQKIEQAGKPVEWRVYRPIASSQSCLACHGDPKTFRPGVKEALDRAYPEDKAIDYSAQEWRGVIRVSLAAVPGTK